MDSSGLNLPSASRDDDQALRAHFQAQAPLRDDGFTASVLQSLPSQQKRDQRTAWVIGIASAIGLAGVYLSGGRPSDLAVLTDQALEYVSNPGLLFIGGVILAALVLTGGAEDIAID